MCWLDRGFQTPSPFLAVIELILNEPCSGEFSAKNPEEGHVVSYLFYFTTFPSPKTKNCIGRPKFSSSGQMPAIYLLNQTKVSADGSQNSVNQIPFTS